MVMFLQSYLNQDGHAWQSYLNQDGHAWQSYLNQDGHVFAIIMQYSIFW
jgi:hypothetical protein